MKTASGAGSSAADPPSSPVEPDGTAASSGGTSSGIAPSASSSARAPESAERSAPFGATPAITIGVDVGGTFTDVFVLDEARGTATVAKVPTTRPDQSGGFLDGIGRRVARLADIGVVVHGTTVGTNALLERKGARSGVITTRGLRDVLAMRRRDRPRTWGLRGRFEPVVDRRHRLEVPERTLADGRVRTPVDLEAVRAAARELLAAGC